MAANSEGISVKAIVVGAVTDIAISMGGGVAIAGVLTAQAMGQGMPRERVQQHVEQAMFSGSWLVVITVLTTLSMVLAGYITGRLAKHSEVKHGLILGAVLLGLTFIFYDPGTAAPSWFEVFSFGAPIPAVLVGAKLAEGRRSRVP